MKRTKQTSTAIKRRIRVKKDKPKVFVKYINCAECSNSFSVYNKLKVKYCSDACREIANKRNSDNYFEKQRENDIDRNKLKVSKFIYILTHPKFDGWCKLGRADNVDDRLLQYQTSCPLREFKMYFHIFVNDARFYENFFKRNFINNGYEWFKIDKEEAKSAILKLKGAENSRKSHNEKEKNRESFYKIFSTLELPKDSMGYKLDI